MALVVADRVWETTSTSGTGTLTLSGAVSGYQTFAAIGNGNTTYYTITNGTNWEVGIGTYTSSGTTLSRDTVLSSSSGGSKITVTSGSFVFVDYPASKAVYEDASDNVTGYSISGGTINGTTIGGTIPAAGTFTTITGQTEVLNGTGQNFCLYSEQFDNAYYTKYQLSVTPNSTTSPTGTTTADTLVEDSSTNEHGLYRNTIVASGFTSYVLSVYAKAAGRNFLVISLKNAGTDNRTWFNVSTGVVGTNAAGNTATITDAGNGWYRCSVARTFLGSESAGLTYALSNADNVLSYTGNGTSGIYLWGSQLVASNAIQPYVLTTTALVYGVPSLSFTGNGSIGQQSDGSLYVSPAGTGAIQAQATTSSTVGGNARGANAVDWQTSRYSASQVASATTSVIAGGTSNVASGSSASVVGGYDNRATGTLSFIGGGTLNTSSGIYSSISAGNLNAATGYYGFVGNGFTNSTTSNSAVTTQSGTMNATTAVTLSGSNASIKVGQYITGTSIASDTYVAAISGTALTLSKVASGSSTSTLSFYTPHGVVVGGGNNQATGSYSFIGGGGDAGTVANRNVASGDWSTVGGGIKNTASSNFSAVLSGGFHTASTSYGSVVCGGGFYGNAISQFAGNTASGTSSFVGSGFGNTASGGFSSVSGGGSNIANAGFSTIVGGYYGTTRSIAGNMVFSPSNNPIGTSANGTQQTALLVLGRQTTDATATVLTSDTSAASGTNQVILPNNSAYYFTGEVVSGVTGGGDSKGWEIAGVIKRGANAGATTLVGSTVTSLYADAGAATWTIGLTADTTNGGLKVTFTGQASTTIRTVCQIRTTEMTF